MSDQLQLRILEIKLKRIEQYNEKLEAALDVNRVPASVSCGEIVHFCETTKDRLVPSIWPTEPTNKYEPKKRVDEVGCCVVV